MILTAKTLEEWTEWSKRDDAWNLFVPSDIRQMLGEIDRLKNDLRKLQGQWIPAKDIPVEFEGLSAWMGGKGSRPEITTIPNGFSREPQHCGGIYFMLIGFPPLPNEAPK